MSVALAAAWEISAMPAVTLSVRIAVRKYHWGVRSASRLVVVARGEVLLLARVRGLRLVARDDVPLGGLRKNEAPISDMTR